MIIKICGMRHAENIRAAELTGADWMGFIFHPASPRAVHVLPAYLPTRCRRIGVFVDTPESIILQRAAEFGLYGVQLHGSETPEQCRRLRETGLKVLRAFAPSSAEDFRRCRNYENSCDYFLFDSSMQGGSGRSFDWSILNSYRGGTPFLLSGGIAPDSLPSLRRLHHSAFCGVDINSRFELQPGLKNIPVIDSFIKNIRTYLP